MAFGRFLKLRHPDRADPRRAGAVAQWLGEHPAGDESGALAQELGFCYLALRAYPEAADVFRRLADREGAKPAPDRGVLSYALLMRATALDGAGQKAEADPVRQRLRTEFADTPSGRAGP